MASSSPTHSKVSLIMHVVSAQIAESQQKASWIRRMFEAGFELKKQFGEDNVYDFSLGNPDLTPPAGILQATRGLAAQIDRPAGLGYMPNAGYPQARAALARLVRREQGVEIPPANIIITVGAAGGLNAFFRAVLNAGDEVICPAPYFVEYGAYCGNFGGVLKPVKAQPLTFALDLPAIEAAITERTRAVIINSPNNPSGAIYSATEIAGLATILEQANARYQRPIFLVSDEPYRFLSFDGRQVPPILPAYEFALVISSFSKNLALAGERVGYIAVNPAMREAETLVSGLILTNRILGFVNAPCLGQLLMTACVDQLEEMVKDQFAVYAERRALMAETLTAAGIRHTLPAGTFYFFPQCPEGIDDVAFVQKLQQHRILAVPGSGFGYPGYFRLALCCDKKFITASRPAFQAAMRN